MLNWIFKKPCLNEVRRNELYAAQSELLLALTRLEANQSNVEYNRKRIARLTADLKKLDEEAAAQQIDAVCKV